MSALKQRKTLRPSRESARSSQPRTDWKRFDAATEAEITKWQLEDGYNEAEEGPLKGHTVITLGVIPETDVRALREYLGLTQEEFAHRYALPIEDVQAWERHDFEPGGAERTLLWLISLAPDVVAKELAIPRLAAA
jgi:DNA-binding transcriptional regulator YiaG